MVSAAVSLDTTVLWLAHRQILPNSDLLHTEDKGEEIAVMEELGRMTIIKNSISYCS